MSDDMPRMNPTSLLAVLLLALAACSAPPLRSVASSEPPPVRSLEKPNNKVPPVAPKQVGLTEEETAKNRARPYVEGLAALDLFRAASDCENQHARDVLDRIAKLREDVTLLHRVQSFPQYEREARDRHIELALSFADEALSRGCLDAADGVYRDIFAFYVGATYSGIRDCAKLGIEDVRARRGATASASK